MALSANISDIKSDQTKTAVAKIGQLDQSEETITETTEYDTSKADSSGKSPIKSQTKTTTKKGSKKTEETKIETAKDTKEASTDKSVIKSESTTEVKETPQPPAAKYYLWILVILVAMAVGIWLYTKRAGIKNIYSRITKS
ncbi:MAG: hypothetical protein JZU65_06095 [Chlorobium sp.]|nr:hypothetical protein [Chlorobium sp.]